MRVLVMVAVALFCGTVLAGGLSPQKYCEKLGSGTCEILNYEGSGTATEYTIKYCKNQRFSVATIVVTADNGPSGSTAVYQDKNRWVYNNSTGEYMPRNPDTNYSGPFTYIDVVAIDFLKMCRILP